MTDRLHKPRVLDARGDIASDQELLLDAQREADAWAKRLASGQTASDRARPLSTKRHDPQAAIESAPDTGDPLGFYNPAS